MEHHEQVKKREYFKFALLIGAIFLVSLGLTELRTGALSEAGSGGGYDWWTGLAAYWMPQFMGIFFLVFAGFKFINLKEFVAAYRGYDLLAKRSRAYAFFYPFLELALGGLYLSGLIPEITSIATILLMGFSSIGVLQVLCRRDEMILCACLGTVIRLPVTTITLVEDL
ncbi:MAG: MauE/DoxX family redox-associated membrane protein, partial [Candidatus Dojkabacteria bacterium]